jgi:methionine-rich copper-binding protein CopC
MHAFRLFTASSTVASAVPGELLRAMLNPRARGPSKRTLPGAPGCAFDLFARRERSAAFRSSPAGHCRFPVHRYRPYMKLIHLIRPARLSFAFGAAALLLTSTAFAHAHLVSSEPAANAEVAAPAEVTLHFTEPLEPAFSKIALADANGKPAASAASQVDKQDARVMHLPLPQLGAGHYAVHWTAVATDGHRTQGDFAFTVK